MSEITIADVFDLFPAIKFEEGENLKAERTIIKDKTAEIAVALVQDRHKDPVVIKIVHQHLFERTDFAARTWFAPDSQCAPSRRPIRHATIAHQWVIAELHGGSINHNGGIMQYRARAALSTLRRETP